MAIEVQSELRSFSEEAFKEIAYTVTGSAFSVYNEYGNLFAEKLYKYEVAAACRKSGLGRVEVEVPIRVTYGDFVKKYSVDVLVDGGALFELKVVSDLVDEHRAQTLNYLFLTGLHRAKLINFGAASVQHEFVSTQVTPASRRRVSVKQDGWNAIDSESTKFFDLLRDLLCDWGCFLQLTLYYEAIAHFFGGEENVIQTVPVICNEAAVTTQRVHLLSPNTAFKLTALSEKLDTVKSHLHRFLSHTSLHAIQWVNLHQQNVTFTTLINDRKYSCQ